MKRFAIVLLIIVGFMGTSWAVTNKYFHRGTDLSEQILLTAAELRDVTRGPGIDAGQAEALCLELKELVTAYEENLVFAQSAYPDEILLGTTPPGKNTWLETLVAARYHGPIKELRIRRTGHAAPYLRINDIEITRISKKGPVTEVFNRNGRTKLHYGGVVQLALPRPMQIRRVRVRTGHASTGLEIYGIPYELPVVHHHREHVHKRPTKPRKVVLPDETLLGTTGAGKNTWLETLCSNPHDLPVKEIRLERTGTVDSYLRISNIEITYKTPHGKKTEVFNEKRGDKLYFGSHFRLTLPRPMRITRIRVLTGHRSTGLKVFGVH